MRKSMPEVLKQKWPRKDRERRRLDDSDKDNLPPEESIEYRKTER
jgi:hypothetical protein